MWLCVCREIPEQSALWLHSLWVSLALAFPHKPEECRAMLIWHQGDTHWFPTRHTLNNRLYGPTNLPLSLLLSNCAPVAFNLLAYLSLATSYVSHLCLSLLKANGFHSLCVFFSPVFSNSIVFSHLPIRPCFPLLLVKLYPPSFSSASFISSPTVSVPPRPGTSLFWYMT